MNNYDPKVVEPKWQKKWDKDHTFAAQHDTNKEKFYALIEFPYPSGAGLHVGHPRPFTAMDVVSRKRRMEGYNVLYPIGFDAFGLPTENYAIKTGRPPAEVTAENIANFTRQLKALGYSFDWDRVIDTTNPEYYKWTQWIFLKLFKNGLAYKKNIPINWCLNCHIGLANEEVVDGKCERCGGDVEKRDKAQWLLAITDYADSLLEGLQDVDYIERAKVQQTNWIGKSEGSRVTFSIKDVDKNIEVFTTRPDTLFGATYMVLSPEHVLVEELKESIKNYSEIIEYKKQASLKSDLERTELQKEKTGVELKGVKAINPVNGEEISVWIADYVLASYGTGAIMAVPGHDERDWEFAKKYDLEIREVISGGNVSEEPYIGEGKTINSDFLDGMGIEEAKEKMISWLEEKNIGKKETNFKLRDWIFSRQRYWGEPMPLVFCENCKGKKDFKSKGEERNPGWILLEEASLPLELPKVDKYEPTDTGESPLAEMTDWVKTTCPRCGSEAKRETDVMPNWAGSSWYWLRYMDPKNDSTFASKEALEYWGQVDWYNGGMEHTVLHLLYSRFWNQFLHDIGEVPNKEPYAKRTSHGLILAEDGEKMSKSKGNVVNPDEMIEKFGADALRAYIMFMGPFDQHVAWDENGLVGVRRFLERVWNLQNKVSEDKDSGQMALIHKTIKKVGTDIEEMKFNTAISAMMELTNAFYKSDYVSKDEYETLLKLVSPFAPHLAEELWYEVLGNKETVTYAPWPTYKEDCLVEDVVTLVVQINGKVRSQLEISKDISEEKVKELALDDEKVKKWLEGKDPKKVIYVPGRLVSIVV